MDTSDTKKILNSFVIAPFFETIYKRARAEMRSKSLIGHHRSNLRFFDFFILNSKKIIIITETYIFANIDYALKDSLMAS